MAWLKTCQYFRRTFKSFAIECWRQQYTYDRFGNRTIDQTNTTQGIPKPNFGVDQTTNRLTAPSGSTMTYDLAGNLIYDSSSGSQGDRSYDAENRMMAARGGLNATWQYYVYDGGGKRIRRNVNTVETWQVYGIGGELVADYGANSPASSPQKEYGYRNGQLLITARVTSRGGTPPVLHDNPLVPNETTIQSRHITELRDAINALRSQLNMAQYAWQTSAAPGSWITADPILEMRIALDQALGAPSPSYAAGLAQGQSILAIHVQELRNRVLAAWNTSSGGIDVRWVVSDQLGTPRMIFDETGGFDNVSRHDYLPFGEELFAGTGGRTPQQGYGAGDGVRQHFTGYERDDETGLDYAHARYFAHGQGRFTGVDPASGNFNSPQSWNAYAYAANNPLRFIDPLGRSFYEGSGANDPFIDEYADQDPKVSPVLGTVPAGDPRETDPNFAAVTYTAANSVDTGGAIQTNETPIVTTLSPSIGPRSGPLPAVRPEPPRGGLLGVSLGGIAAIGYGGVTAVEGAYALGINTSGNGGIGGAGSFGVISTDEAPMGGLGYPGDEGWGYGVAFGKGVSGFYSNAAEYSDLRGPFGTTVIATPLITLQFDQAVGNTTRVLSISGPSGLGIFHFKTTTPSRTTFDVPVLEPLNKY